MAFAHVALGVRDVERSARFLEATLGWRIIPRPSNVDRPVIWLAMGDGQEVHLIQVPDFAPSPFEREFGRHIAVTYPGAGFEDLKTRLREHGVEVIPPVRPTPFERFFFQSPDGYVFEVVGEEREPEVRVEHFRG